MDEPTEDDDVFLICRVWPSPDPMEHFLMTTIGKSTVRECEFCQVKVYFADASSEIFTKYPKTKIVCGDCAKERAPDKPINLLPETRADLVRTLGEAGVKEVEERVRDMNVNDFVASYDDSEVFCEEFK